MGVDRRRGRHHLQLLIWGRGAICQRLGPAQIQALHDKWLAILPSAFTELDRAAGYRNELSVLYPACSAQSPGTVMGTW